MGKVRSSLQIMQTIPSSIDFQGPEVTAETFVIPLEDGKYIIYAPLRSAAFVANAKMVNFLADCQEGKWTPESDPDERIADFLREMEILDSEYIEERPVQTYRGKPKPTAVTLFLTTACNLRCTYCYASAGDKPGRFMKPDVAKRGIEYVARNAAKAGKPHISITYHGGGEPTVNWPTLTESLAYAKELGRELGLKIVATTATNGVLRDSQIDWIVANLDGASVSMDGTPEIQDKNRPAAGGGGSSAQLMHTLRRFEKAGFPYGLRVTCTAENIPHLPESVEYICANFSPRRLQVEPAYAMGRWKDAPSAETEQFVIAYREAQTRAAKYGKELTYSGARAGMLTSHFCGITQDSFGLSPDGGVSACYEVFEENDPSADVFFYGKPDAEKGYDFDMQRLGHLRKQAVQHRDFCKGCFAKWNCAGDCYHKSVVTNGRSEFAGSDRCHITRELTKDQIITLIGNAGGIAWKGDAAVELGGGAGKEMMI